MTDQAMHKDFAPSSHELSDDQIERIAERAAEKAVAKITDQLYREIGRSVISKLSWTVGVLVIGSMLWFKGIKGG